MRFNFHICTFLRIIVVVGIIGVVAAAVGFVLSSASENAVVTVMFLLMMLFAVTALAAVFRSEIVLGATSLRVAMSWLGSVNVPYASIVDVREYLVPWFAGYGIRMLGRKKIGFVTSRDALELVLGKPVKVRLLGVFRLTAERLCVTPQRRESFATALRGRAGAFESGGSVAE
jgi:hypothetical protein